MAAPAQETAEEPAPAAGAAAGVGALVAGVVLAHLPLFSTPMLLGPAQVGLGIGTRGAGLLASLEYAGFALATLAAGTVASEARSRRSATRAAAALVLAQLGAALAGALWPVALLRLGSGLAGGWLAACAFGAIATTRAPERTSARAYGLLVVVSAASYWLIPIVAEGRTHRAAYGYLTLATAALVPLVLRGAGAFDRRGAAPAAGARGIAWPILLATLLVTASDGLVWPFVERLGAGIGIPARPLGVWLGLSMVAGIAGAAGADRLGTRAGFRAPALVTAWATALAGLGLALATDAGPFLASAFGKNVTIFACVPYLVGGAAQADPSGRSAALAGGAFPLGSALGSLAGGALLAGSGSAALGVCGLVLLALATPLILRALPGRGGAGLIDSGAP